MQSAGKPAIVEKGLLLRRRGAAQDRVAMRETSEAANDIGMPLGVFAELIIVVAARQLQAAFLVREVFRVHERQIEEHWRSGCETCRSKPRPIARLATPRASLSVA